MNPHLSVIIPSFNEAKRLGPTLVACKEYLSHKPYLYEIIVVDDGSTDDSVALVEEQRPRIPHLKLISLATNQGKGTAVKIGMLSAKGERRLFMDADNSTSIEQVEKLMPYLEQGYDIVAGSRRIDGAVIKVRQKPTRNFLGVIFRTVVHILLPTGLKDTQNGFKLFSAKAAERIFPKLKIKSWSFDVEVLISAQKFGLKVKEVPIVWENDGRSRMRFVHMMRMLVDLVYIKVDDKRRVTRFRVSENPVQNRLK